MNSEKLVDHRIGIIGGDDSPAESDKLVELLVDAGFKVLVTVAEYDYNLSWKVGSDTTIRHYQCTFGNYPRASDWELQHLNEYFLYEIAHGRKIALWCKSAQIEKTVKDSVKQFFSYDGLTLSEFVRSRLDSQADRAQDIPERLTHCTACEERSCVTSLICHVTAVPDAESILREGTILSASRARHMSGEELSLEGRNAAGDPPDYFDYVMLTFGNCTAGDNLVMERALGSAPTPMELDSQFCPGVRFYFRYKDLVGHPGFRSDGYHFCKIWDRIALEDYLAVAVAPESARSRLSRMADVELKKRLVFIDQTRYSDLGAWSHTAYETAKQRIGTS